MKKALIAKTIIGALSFSLFFYLLFYFFSLRSDNRGFLALGVSLDYTFPQVMPSQSGDELEHKLRHLKEFLDFLEFSENKDLSVFWAVKGPTVFESLRIYAPGLLDKIEQRLKQKKDQLLSCGYACAPLSLFNTEELREELKLSRSTLKEEGYLSYWSRVFYPMKGVYENRALQALSENGFEAVLVESSKNDSIASVDRLSLKERSIFRIPLLAFEGLQHGSELIERLISERKRAALLLDLDSSPIEVIRKFIASLQNTDSLQLTLLDDLLDGARVLGQHTTNSIVVNAEFDDKALLFNEPSALKLWTHIERRRWLRRIFFRNHMDHSFYKTEVANFLPWFSALDLSSKNSFPSFERQDFVWQESIKTLISQPQALLGEKKPLLFSEDETYLAWTIGKRPQDDNDQALRLDVPREYSISGETFSLMKKKTMPPDEESNKHKLTLSFLEDKVEVLRNKNTLFTVQTSFQNKNNSNIQWIVSAPIKKLKKWGDLWVQGKEWQTGLGEKGRLEFLWYLPQTSPEIYLQIQGKIPPGGTTRLANVETNFNESELVLAGVDADLRLWRHKKSFREKESYRPISFSWLSLSQNQKGILVAYSPLALSSPGFGTLTKDHNLNLDLFSLKLEQDNSPEALNLILMFRSFNGDFPSKEIVFSAENFSWPALDFVPDENIFKPKLSLGERVTGLRVFQSDKDELDFFWSYPPQHVQCFQVEILEQLSGRTLNFRVEGRRFARLQGIKLQEAFGDQYFQKDYLARIAASNCRDTNGPVFRSKSFKIPARGSQVFVQ